MKNPKTRFWWQVLSMIQETGATTYGTFFPIHYEYDNKKYIITPLLHERELFGYEFHYVIIKYKKDFVKTNEGYESFDIPCEKINWDIPEDVWRQEIMNHSFDVREISGWNEEKYSENHLKYIRIFLKKAIRTKLIEPTEMNWTWAKKNEFKMD